MSIQPANPTQLDLLTFSSNDLQSIHLSYDNPLVVTLSIANDSIKGVLIDIYISADILFTKSFNQLERKTPASLHTFIRVECV